MKRKRPIEGLLIKHGFKKVNDRLWHHKTFGNMLTDYIEDENEFLLAIFNSGKVDKIKEIKQALNIR